MGSFLRHCRGGRLPGEAVGKPGHSKVKQALHSKGLSWMCLLDLVGASGHPLTGGPWWGAGMWTCRRLFSLDFFCWILLHLARQDGFQPPSCSAFPHAPLVMARGHSGARLFGTKEDPSHCPLLPAFSMSHCFTVYSTPEPSNLI